MSLETVELWVGWLGCAGIVLLSVAVLWSVMQARDRRVGRVAGARLGLIQSPWFLAVGTVASLILCWALWRPIPLMLSDGARIGLLAVGSLLYFGGLALAAWGRITLGEMHNVSTTRGAELFEGHRLITSGPFAFVRNPMYVGALAMALGALPIYRTWTVVMLALCALVFIRRARREEEALAAQFGDEWTEYCKRVPAWIPRLSHRSEGPTHKEIKPA